MSHSRAKGTGSVYQRKDGKWIAALPFNGKRIVRYASTEKAAYDALHQLLLEFREGTLAEPNKVTLEEWVTEWLAMMEPQLRPSTRRTYRSVLAMVVEEAGGTKLSKLTPLVLTKLFNRLRTKRGARRVHLAHTCLKSCLKRAVMLGLLGTNPMERVPVPHWERQERRYWTLKETRRFVSTGLTTSRKLGPLFAFLALSGLRISEALALAWEDVDWDTPSVRVSKALVWSGNTYDIVPPKTNAGRRVVSLPAPALAALQRVRERSQSEEGPIFRSLNGEPLGQSHLREALITLCSEADVPQINVHGLRHVAAMLALEAVGDAYAVQRRLGHSHIGVTLAIYGYSARTDNSLASAVNDLLQPD